MTRLNSVAIACATVFTILAMPTMALAAVKHANPVCYEGMIPYPNGSCYGPTLPPPPSPPVVQPPAVACEGTVFESFAINSSTGSGYCESDPNMQSDFNAMAKNAGYAGAICIYQDYAEAFSGCTVIGYAGYYVSSAQLAFDNANPGCICPNGIAW